ISESRTLSEEAYHTAGDERKRKQAAIQRALAYKDDDDEITWLERADTTLPDIKAMLAMARGCQALHQGKDEEAVPCFREARQLYASLPENTGTLNNGALACQGQFQATGEPEMLDHSLRMIEKALRLRPGDSILLGNLADASLGAALRDLIGD